MLTSMAVSEPTSKDMQRSSPGEAQTPTTRAKQAPAAAGVGAEGRRQARKSLFAQAKRLFCMLTFGNRVRTSYRSKFREVGTAQAEALRYPWQSPQHLS